MGRYKKLLLLAILITGCVVTKPPVVNPRLSPGVVFGEDYYALQSKYWNVPSSLLDPLLPPKGYGILDTTFGTDLTPVKVLLATLSPDKFRIHIINGPCIRNGNCGPYEIGYKWSKAAFDNAIKAHDKRIINPFVTRLLLYAQLISQFPGTQFYISPELEHDLSIQSWHILADYVHTTIPSGILVNSPDGGVAIDHYLGALFERHGDHPQPDADINSLDGVSASQIDIDAWRNRILAAPHIQLAFLWIDLFNCRTDVFQDPRVRQSCPLPTTFELVRHLIDVMPPPPGFSGTQCHTFRPFADPDIWKPLSESHPTPDPRAQLPVLITKGFGPNANVKVIARNGQQVGVLGFYGTYLTQGYRWYSGFAGGDRNSGYQYQKQAFALTGSPWVWLEQKGTCKGPLIPGRRQGKFD